MDNIVYEFLMKPRRILTQIRRAEAQLEGLRLSLYPSAIRYDTDKVMSSPSDPMPQYAVRVDEIQDQLKKLRLEYINAQDDICTATLRMSQIEQEVIMLRYVAHYSWRRIIHETGKSEATVFRAHRRAQKYLKKYLDNLEVTVKDSKPE